MAKPRGYQGWLGTSGKKKRPRQQSALYPRSWCIDPLICATQNRELAFFISDNYPRDMNATHSIFINGLCILQLCSAKVSSDPSNQDDLSLSGFAGSGSGVYFEAENYWSLHPQSKLNPWMLGLGAGILFPLGLSAGAHYSASPLDQVYVEEIAPLEYAQYRDKISQFEFRAGYSFKPNLQKWEIGARFLFSKFESTQDATHKISSMVGKGLQLQFAIPALSFFYAQRWYPTTTIGALGVSIPLGLRSKQDDAKFN